MPTAPHVMVVDDEAVNRETLRALLIDLGIKVTACANASEALAVLRAEDAVNLIFSDVLMPGMDGIELSRAVHKIRPHVPFVLVTGRDSAADSVVSKGTLALLKPYSIAALKGVLREHLGITV